MLVKLRAVVLGQVKYGDNSRILRCFTDRFGQQSYMIQGIHRKQAVLRPSMLQPLSLLELEAYHRGKGQLERIKEARWLKPYDRITTEPASTAQALFLGEILQRLLRAEEAHEAFFDRLQEMLLSWDSGPLPSAGFHLEVLAVTAKELGFVPPPAPEGENYFDLLEGDYLPSPPLHAHVLSPALAAYWDELFYPGRERSWNRQLRNEILDALLDYFRLHLENFGAPKSLEVVRELMR